MWSWTLFLLTFQWLHHWPGQVETSYTRRNFCFDFNIICVPDHNCHPVLRLKNLCITHKILATWGNSFYRLSLLASTHPRSRWIARRGRCRWFDGGDASSSLPSSPMGRSGSSGLIASLGNVLIFRSYPVLSMVMSMTVRPNQPTSGLQGDPLGKNYTRLAREIFFRCLY